MEEQKEHYFTKPRPIAARHMVPYLVYHQQRAAWLRKQRRSNEATKHEQELGKALAMAKPNEKASYEFIALNLGDPDFPKVKAYEDYPLPARWVRTTSKWITTGKKRMAWGISFDEDLGEQIKASDEMKTKDQWQRVELIRDIIAEHFDIKPPKKTI
jgi:hypothetical protein